MLKLFIKTALFLFLTTNILNASKIVSVGGSITETIVALGHQNDLVGVDLSSVYPQDITSKLPNVGYWLSLPQEGILSLEPTVAIISSQAKPKKVVDELPNFGIKTYVIEDGATLDSAKNKIIRIGQILNENEKASAIISRIEKNISTINNKIKGKKKPKVLFLFSTGKNNLMAAGPNTKPGAMIELAGGENAIEFPQYTKISSEAILEINPDVIISSNHRGENKLSNLILTSTNAGKNSQIYTMDMLLISGFSVRIDEALEKLTCMFNENTISYCKK